MIIWILFQFFVSVSEEVLGYLKKFQICIFGGIASSQLLEARALVAREFICLGGCSTQTREVLAVIARGSETERLLYTCIGALRELTIRQLRQNPSVHLDSLSHTHTHTHATTHTHTRTHTYTHTHTHKHTHMPMHAICTHTHTLIHTRTYKMRIHYNIRVT